MGMFGAPARESDASPVVVVATSAESTRSALPVARALSAYRGSELDIVIAPPETLHVSSALAHVHDLPLESSATNAAASSEFVRALAATDAPEARVIVGRSMDWQDMPAWLPPHTTIVLSGPIRRLLESSEQRLGRQLSRAGYEVVFVPRHRG